MCTMTDNCCDEVQVVSAFHHPLQAVCRLRHNSITPLSFTSSPVKPVDMSCNDFPKSQRKSVSTVEGLSVSAIIRDNDYINFDTTYENKNNFENVDRNNAFFPKIVEESTSAQSDVVPESPVAETKEQERNVSEHAADNLTDMSTTAENSSVVYNYHIPATSPFYQNVLGPFCDWLCYNAVPDSVTPDQLSLAGLFCAGLAVLFTHPLSPLFNASFGFLFAGLLWMGYSLFDNLDGKQARRLKKSSPGGEFLDHSCDSVVVTLCGILWMNVLIPSRMNSWKLILIEIGGQIPFYLATWGHLTLGRLILGASITGTDWLTVDEFNFLYIPLICFLRHASPVFWETPALSLIGINTISASNLQYVYSLVASVLDCPDGEITIGVLLVLYMVSFSVIRGIRVAQELWDWHYVELILSGVFFFVLASWYKVSLFLLVTPYSVLCMELQAIRLGLHDRRLIYLWWPNIVFILLIYISFDQRGGMQLSNAGIYYYYRNIFVGTISVTILFLCLTFYKELINAKHVASNLASNEINSD